MGFWSGFVGEINRIEDRNERRDEFNRQVREKRFDTMMQYGLQYGSGTRTSAGGDERATGSTVSAAATQNTNIEYLRSVGISDETLSSFIGVGPTAVADAADIIRATKAEFSEYPNLVNGEFLDQRLSSVAVDVVEGKTINWDDWSKRFQIDLSDDEREMLSAVTPAPTRSAIITDNWTAPVSMPDQKTIDDFNTSVGNNMLAILDEEKRNLEQGLTSVEDPQQKQAISSRINDIISWTNTINNSDGQSIPFAALNAYGGDAMSGMLNANPGLLRAAETGALSGSAGRLLQQAPRITSAAEAERLEPGSWFVSMIPGSTYGRLLKR